MFEPLFDNEERGQVGIGTLIVFIAMVLVAAIAAGVLINTAGFLQTQAEATGQESTEQVSNNLQVESVVSEVESGPQINAIAIDVSLAPGSNPIDITSATLEWIGSSDSGTFSITAADPAQDSTSLDPVIADNQNFETELTDTGDTARIYILSGTASTALDLGSATGAGTGSGVADFPLTGGAEAQVTITAPGGGQTTVAIRVPDVLVSGEGVRL
jgi:flagellin-like protein